MVAHIQQRQLFVACFWLQTTCLFQRPLVCLATPRAMATRHCGVRKAALPPAFRSCISQVNPLHLMPSQRVAGAQPSLVLRSWTLELNRDCTGWYKQHTLAFYLHPGSFD
jgi:hypothetical protein